MIMVDLIPAEYRRALRVQRLLQRLGWAGLSLVLAFGLCAAGLAHLLNEERTALARYKHLQAQAQAQQARLAEIRAQRDRAGRQVQALDTLRGGASTARLFDAVDAALNGRIWFQELVYARAGVAPAAQAAAAGAAAAAGKRDAAGAEENPQRARERAEIRGVAIDHATLAEFIKTLATRPGMHEVRLLDTGSRNYPGAQVVDFQVAALLGTVPGAIPAAANAAPAVTSAVPLAAVLTAASAAPSALRAPAAGSPH